MEVYTGRGGKSPLILNPCTRTEFSNRLYAAVSVTMKQELQGGAAGATNSDKCKYLV